MKSVMETLFCRQYFILLIPNKYLVSASVNVFHSQEYFQNICVVWIHCFANCNNFNRRILPSLPSLIPQKKNYYLYFSANKSIVFKLKYNIILLYCISSFAVIFRPSRCLCHCAVLIKIIKEFKYRIGKYCHRCDQIMQNFLVPLVRIKRI